MKNASWKWIVWLLVVAFFFYEFVLRVAPSVMVSNLMRTFAIDAASVGLISGLYFYIYAPMQLPVGILMDRFGPRKLLSSAALLCGVGAIFFGIAHTPFLLGGGRLLMGLGSSFAFVGLLYLTSHLFARRKLAFLIGLSNSIAMLGAVSGEGPISLLETSVGWRSTSIILGSVGILLSILLMIVMSKNASFHQKTSSLRSAYHSFIKVTTCFDSWLNAFIPLFLYTTTSAFAALWAVPFLERVHALSRSEAGFASSMIYVGWIIGGPLIGHFSDKVQKRSAFIQGGSLLAFCAMLPVIFLSPSTPLLFFFLILVGIFSAVELLNFSYAIELHTPDATGSAIAFTNCIIMLGGALFQPFVGWILDLLQKGEMPLGFKLTATGDYRLAMSFFPLTFLCAFLLSLFLKERPSKK